MSRIPPSVTADALDGHGTMFGWRREQRTEGGKRIGDLIHLYVEDDGLWHWSDAFDELWLPDMRAVLAAAAGEQLSPQGAPMSALSTIASLMPLVQSAVDVLAAFQGTAKAASASKAVTDAAEVISAAAPLIESFTSGQEVTEQDVRDALAGMDQALASFDAEIARQSGP